MDSNGIKDENEESPEATLIPNTLSHDEDEENYPLTSIITMDDSLPLLESYKRVPSPPLANMEEDFSGPDIHHSLNGHGPNTELDTDEGEEGDFAEGREFPDEPDSRFPMPTNGLTPYPYGSGTIIADENNRPVFIPDVVNTYQQKKNLAQGMMDLALLSANANQLRYVLETFDRHPYNYVSLVLISFSLIFQVAVGIGLIINSQYNVTKADQMEKADKINNYTIIGIFLVTVFNVFITSFGVGETKVVAQ